MRYLITIVVDDNDTTGISTIDASAICLESGKPKIFRANAEDYEDRDEMIGEIFFQVREQFDN